jgi:hypothetical protein
VTQGPRPCDCHDRARKAVGGYAPALECGGRPCGPTPLRCSVSWPVAKLATLTAFAMLEQSRRVRSRSALRARPRALALQAAQGLVALPLARHGQSTGLSASGLASSAPHVSLPAHTHPRLCERHRGTCRRTPRALLRGGRYRVGAICGAARSGAPGSARVQRALPFLTRRDCSSATNAVSAASFAARPRREHRSGVGAKHRPPQYEPLPGTARRAAHTTACADPMSTT